MPSKPLRILILGNGAMGTMFSELLGPGFAPEIWYRELEDQEPAALERMAVGRELILFALPAQPHGALAARLAPVMDADTVCLSIAKGVDEHGRTPVEIFSQALGPERHWGMIYGPMIARDLRAGKAGFGVLAGNSARARSMLEVFAATPLYLDASDDLIGAAWSVVLKNVYVPLLGAADALELGDNLRGFFIFEAVHELEAIVLDRGGRSKTARGPAGMGDLITSATSRSSHHRTIGAELAFGRSEKILAGGEYIRSEGVHTAHRVREYHLVPRGRYPLFDLACDFLTGPMDLSTALCHYFEKRFGRSG